MKALGWFLLGVIVSVAGQSLAWDSFWYNNDGSLTWRQEIGNGQALHWGGPTSGTLETYTGNMAQRTTPPCY